MQRRLPKRGFKSPNRVEYVGINLDRIQEIIEKYNVAEISPESLQSNRIVGKKDRIKILGRGELKGAVKISAHAVSASAKLAIEGNGGSITLV